MASETSTGQTTAGAELDLRRPLPPELHPNIDHIVTEDDTPVDNIFSEKQQRLLTEPLFSSWKKQDGPQRFVALTNVGLFFGVQQPPYVPDMLLSLDVELPENIWLKRNRSYFVWECGKPPEVVVEVVSNREGGEDNEKFKGYARAGVHYYVIFDPEQQLGDEVLRAFQLVGLTYQPLAEPVWLPGVELGLRLWEGEYEDRREVWLRWTDASQAPIPTGAERASYEQQRADQERQRADQEQQRAEQERQRAERLAEQLRRLGQAPEV